MSEHKMTISGLSPSGWHCLPSRAQVPLLLDGMWMRDASFYPGVRVRAEVVEEGRFVVTRADEGDACRDWRPVAWVPAEQAGRAEES